MKLRTCQYPLHAAQQPKIRIFYVYNAILSRSTVFEFKPVEPDEVEKAVYRASDFLAEESGTDIEMPEECAKKIASGLRRRCSQGYECR